MKRFVMITLMKTFLVMTLIHMLLTGCSTSGMEDRPEAVNPLMPSAWPNSAPHMPLDTAAPLPSLPEAELLVAPAVPMSDPSAYKPEPPEQAAAPEPEVHPKAEEIPAVPASGLTAEAQTPAALQPAANKGGKTVAAAAYESGKAVSIPVLNYHSIGKKPGSTIVLDPELLAAQMAYLHQEGYTPLTLSAFQQILEKKLERPAKPVLLTFDDGYADNYELAMPILKQYAFPATLFMSPGAVGDPFYITWEQAKEMKEAGWDIQPHGMTHPRMSKLSRDKQRHEIQEASRLIEEELGVKPDVFCYPYGDFNKDTLAILKELGFRYAFTIEQGRAASDQEPLQLKRIYVNGQDSLKQWAKKLGN
ncbi:MULTISPECIES: polysaccharide deacetylase family protein [unclassified Paenibacillus]|uniref:polysaccharide deacetylase family protein n=1 Tax=unclassified Paenibacillus TaxID=185978 RepID=UPI002108C186|nr:MULTISPECIES: polysaccharide deacetylase family protein [unclassified Paenibacillus]